MNNIDRQRLIKRATAALANTKGQLGCIRAEYMLLECGLIQAHPMPCVGDFLHHCGQLCKCVKTNATHQVTAVFTNGVSSVAPFYEYETVTNKYFKFGSTACGSMRVSLAYADGDVTCHIIDNHVGATLNRSGIISHALNNGGHSSMSADNVNCADILDRLSRRYYLQIGTPCLVENDSYTVCAMNGNYVWVECDHDKSMLSLRIDSGNIRVALRQYDSLLGR